MIVGGGGVDDNWGGDSDSWDGVMVMIVGVATVIVVGVATVIVGVDGRSVMILISLIMFMDTVHTNL